MCDRVPDKRDPIESLSQPEAHDKDMIKLYNEGMTYQQIATTRPGEWSRNLVENRLKMMAAMGHVTLRPAGGSGARTKGGQFKKTKEEK